LKRSERTKAAPEFTWRHYVFGDNMIAGTLQTFALIFAASALFAVLSECLSPLA
jgi:hypothetical protein